MAKDPSPLELKFDFLWNELFPDIDLETEQKLIPKRRFKHDYYHAATATAIEVNGQVFQVGGHSSGTGITRDYTKSNLGLLNGFVTFQLSSNMITEEWLTLIGNYIKDKLAQQGS